MLSWQRCAGSSSKPHPYRGSVCTRGSRVRRRISTSPKRSSSPARHSGGKTLGEPDEHLACILPLEQADERLGRVLDAVNNRLLPLELAGGNPDPHIGIELGLPIEMVGD